MRILSSIFLLILALSSTGQKIKSFPFVKFDKVVLYDYEPYPEDPSLIDKNGNILSTVKIKKKNQLDTAGIRKLDKRITDKKSYGQATAMCFDPHLGIVYYLNGKVVRQVLICLDCNVLRSDIDITAQHQNKQGHGDKAYYLSDGLSKSFREFLNELLIKYNFSHQIQAGSMFDK